MGLVKKFWMELEEKGDWPFGLEHKKVCTHHFEDFYLNKMIEEYGEQGGNPPYERKVISI